MKRARICLSLAVAAVGLAGCEKDEEKKPAPSARSMAMPSSSRQAGGTKSSGTSPRSDAVSAESDAGGPASPAAFRNLPVSFDGGAQAVAQAGDALGPIPAPPASASNPAPQAGGGDPTAGIEYIQLKATGFDFIQDIRSRDPQTRSYKTIETAVHEGTHFINKQIRLARGAGLIGTGLYIEDGKAVWFNEPALVKDSVRPYIPALLKAPTNSPNIKSRYQAYVMGTEHATHFWNLFDEWSAYINGNRALVETASTGDWRSSPTQTGVDLVDGTVEFMIFGVAMSAAIAAQDPGYFAKNPSFKPMVALEIERSMRWINAGLAYVEPNGNRPFSRFNASAQLQDFRNNRQNEPLRRMLKDWYGAAWTSRVLGF